MGDDDRDVASAVGTGLPMNGAGQAVSAVPVGIPDAERARLYAEQMAEVANVDVILEGLRDEINACKATAKGYREANEIRSSMRMWSDMRARMLAFAATVAPAIAIEAGTATTGTGVVHESAGPKAIAETLSHTKQEGGEHG